MRPELLHREPVREQQVVGHRHGTPEVALARCVHPIGVRKERRTPRLVDGEPDRHLVAQRLEHRARVEREVGGAAARHPAAFVLQGLWQVPVVERGHRLDAGLAQQAHQAPVVVDASGVERAAARGHHTRPRDREAVRLHAELAQQRHVFLDTAVGVAGAIAGVAVGDTAGGLGKGVPDAGRAAVGIGAAFDLVGRGGSAPEEAGWKSEVVGLHARDDSEPCKRLQ